MDLLAYHASSRRRSLPAQKMSRAPSSLLDVRGRFQARFHQRRGLPGWSRRGVYASRDCRRGPARIQRAPVSGDLPIRTAMKPGVALYFYPCREVTDRRSGGDGWLLLKADGITGSLEEALHLSHDGQGLVCG